MPLSEHEKRLLDEIEQTLRTDDPGLASSLRSARPLPRTRILLLTAILALLASVGLLIVGLQLRDNAGTACGALGFVAAVAGTDCALRVASRMRADRRAAGRAPRRWRR